MTNPASTHARARWCGDACLRFETNQRYARTASYAQVAEKLYDRPCQRHRNCRRPLEAVLPILGSAIERLGYAA